MQRWNQPRRLKLAHPLLRRSIFGLLASLVVSLDSGISLAQSTLNEAEVSRLARAHAPASGVAKATDALADARTRTAGLLPNPSLSWNREAIVTSPSGAENTISASLPIDIAAPMTRRSLTASTGAWSKAKNALTRTQATLQAMLAYYEVALAQQRMTVLKQAGGNLKEAVRVLKQREAAGTASGYESTRLLIASELNHSQLAMAHGSLGSARARLAALVGLPAESIQVSGTLSLVPTPPETPTTSAPREAIKQARSAQRLAQEATARADWAWLPRVRLGGGLRHVTDQGGGYGYTAGISFDLPVFDHGQTLRAEAAASRTLSAARSAALSRTLTAQFQSERALFRSARHELKRFESQTAGLIQSLLAAAQSGYREGERSLIELLDAQRAQTDVAMRRLALLGAAKRAEARMRAAAGKL